MDSLNQGDEDLSFGQISRVVRDVNAEARKERRSVSETLWNIHFVCAERAIRCADVTVDLLLIAARCLDLKINLESWNCLPAWMFVEAIFIFPLRKGTLEERDMLRRGWGLLSVFSHIKSTHTIHSECSHMVFWKHLVWISSALKAPISNWVSWTVQSCTVEGDRCGAHVAGYVGTFVGHCGAHVAGYVGTYIGRCGALAMWGHS